MRLVPRDPALIGIDDRKRFADVVRAAFGQRRKTLRNALRNVCDEDAMRAAGVDPQARAEQLEVADFVRLANVGALEAKRSEEHTSELQSLMRISYAVFCLQKQKQCNNKHSNQDK